MDPEDDPRRPLLDQARSTSLAPAASAAAGPHPSKSSPPTSAPTQEHAGAAADNNMDLYSAASRKSQWIILAVASGACAAFNGVFAKLTTTQLTTTFATSIANLLGLGKGEKAVEVVVRAIFFILNLIFNGIMWTLFTKALARGTSTTQVSIINTSSNFMITAVLGFIIFSESLPPLWFLGAALLVAGNVIIGRREEQDDGLISQEGTADEEIADGVHDAEGEGLLVGESVELESVAEEELEEERKKKQEEDILQLGLEDERHNGDEELI